MVRNGTERNKSESAGDRIIKVNHAGENGAVSIYRGQIFMARWTAPAMLPQLRLFCEHEQLHRAIFSAELERRGHRRRRSYGLCAFGGWVLGLLTGLPGASAIAATTAAVERVVLRHLERQLITLRGVDVDAVTAITAIVEDERVHRDHGERLVEPDSFWMRVLTPIVSASTEIVIWLGMRLRETCSAARVVGRGAGSNAGDRPGQGGVIRKTPTTRASTRVWRRKRTRPSGRVLSCRTPRASR